MKKDVKKNIIQLQIPPLITSGIYFCTNPIFNYMMYHFVFSSHSNENKIKK